MEMPEQFLGYNKEAETIEEKMGMSEVGLVCMVARIDAQNIQMACQQSGLDFKLGDWFVFIFISWKAAVIIASGTLGF